MSAEYTIPALRDTANELRAKAAAHYAAEDIKAQQILAAARRDADAMCASAAEIDADADAKEAVQQQAAAPVPCWNCGQPVVTDELGSWRHAPGTPTACQVPGPSEHKHYRPGPTDALVVSQQSVVETAVDGQGAES